MIDLSWIGIWLLVIGVIFIVVELTLAGIWSVRIVNSARALSKGLTSEQARLQADVERLRGAMADMQVLWRPYGRALRWLRHPVAIALLQSLARRRAPAR
jgi:hypothetical protein